MIRKTLQFLLFALFVAGCASSPGGGSVGGVMRKQPPQGDSNPWVK